MKIQIFRDRSLASALILAGSLAATACGGNALGTLGQVLGAAGMGGTQASQGQGQGQGQGQISATVTAINTQARTLTVRTTDNQTGAVSYDQNTVVVYQQKQYPVTSLERGDVIVLTVQQVSQSQLYASRIDVTQSVQQQNGQNTSNGQVVQYSGTVAQIDQQRGTFQIQGRSGAITVSLPYNAPQATSDYFRRLRNGNSVRVEVTPLGNGRYEIYRFL